MHITWMCNPEKPRDGTAGVALVADPVLDPSARPCAEIPD
jgi:hypothetical protein